MEAASITLTETDTPSRSKQAGPCWIAATDPTTGAPTIATRGGRTLDGLEPGTVITITAKVSLRRSKGGSDIARRVWTVVATGNESDTVDLQAGSPQAVKVTVTGVELVAS